MMLLGCCKDSNLLSFESTVSSKGFFTKQYLRPDVKPQRPFDIRAEIFDFP